MAARAAPPKGGFSGSDIPPRRVLGRVHLIGSKIGVVLAVERKPTTAPVRRCGIDHTRSARSRPGERVAICERRDLCMRKICGCRGFAKSATVRICECRLFSKSVTVKICGCTSKYKIRHRSDFDLPPLIFERRPPPPTAQLSCRRRRRLQTSALNTSRRYSTSREAERGGGCEGDTLLKETVPRPGVD